RSTTSSANRSASSDWSEAAWASSSAELRASQYDRSALAGLLACPRRWTVPGSRIPAQKRGRSDLASHHAHRTPLYAAKGLGTQRETLISWIREQGAHASDQRHGVQWGLCRRRISASTAA